MQQKLLLATKDTASGNTHILLRMERGSFELVFVQVQAKPRQASFKKGAKLSLPKNSSPPPLISVSLKGSRPTYQDSISKQF